MPSSYGQEFVRTRALKRICEEYLNDTGILKEQLQNADDAGAKRVSFCLDKRTHGKSKLGVLENWNKLKSWQGPAFLFSQDAQFQERDFQSLASPGNSRKKFDPTKTGKFGVGFNACYHITDVPMFISGRHLMVLDPHDKYLYDGQPERGGQSEDLLDGSKGPPPCVALSELIGAFNGHGGVVEAKVSEGMGATGGVLYAGAEMPSQEEEFSPLAGASAESTSSGDLQSIFSRNCEITGTIFRFPLRTKSLGKASKIKSEPFTIDDAERLLTDFRAEVPELLLFLKNVAEISVWEWNEGELEPRKLSLARISNMTRELREKRMRLKSFLDEHMAQALEAAKTAERVARYEKDDPDYHDHLLRAQYIRVLDKVRCRAVEFPSESYTIEVEIENADGTGHKETWIKSLRWGEIGGEALRLALDSIEDEDTYDNGFKFVPFAEVAARVSWNDKALHEEQRTQGRLFVTMPVGEELTSLPVHINGGFELTTSRRNIIDGKKLKANDKKRYLWNKALIEEISTRCYFDVLEMLLGQQPFEVDFYGLWPGDLNSSKLWHRITAEDNPLSLHRLWVGHGLPLHKDGQIKSHESAFWFPIDEAVFPEFDSSNVPEDVLAILEDELGVKIVHFATKALDEGFSRALQGSNLALKRITPSAVVEFLKNAVRENARMEFRQNHALVASLLDYILSDGGGIKAESLDSCPLLPLRNGDTGVFSSGTATSFYLSVSEVETAVFAHPCLSGLLLKRDVLSKETVSTLGRLAESKAGCLNLRMMAPPCLAEKGELKQAFVEALQATDPNDEKQALWLRSCWTYIASVSDSDLALLSRSSLPFLLTTHAGMQPVTPENGACIRPWGEKRVDEDITEALLVLQCFVLHPGVESLATKLKHFTFSPDGNGVLQALAKTIGRSGGSARAGADPRKLKRCNSSDEAKIMSISVPTREKMRKFFVREANSGAISKEHVGILRELPLFEPIRSTESDRQMMKLSDTPGPPWVAPKDRTTCSVGVADGQSIIVPELCPPTTLHPMYHSDETKLLALLDVEIWTKSKMLLMYGFRVVDSGSLAMELRNCLMLEVLHSYRSMRSDGIDPSQFDAALKRCKFVPVPGNPSRLLQPCNERWEKGGMTLVDPDMEMAEPLFAHDEIKPFPAEPFTEAGTLGILRELGMTKSLGRDAIVERVEEVLNLAKRKEIDKALALASTLCSFLANDRIFQAFMDDSHPHSKGKNFQGFIQLLAVYPWLPVLRERPTPLPMPFAGSDLQVPFAAAEEVVLQSDALRFESTLKLLAVDIPRSSFFSQSLHLDSDLDLKDPNGPKAHMLVSHLLALVDAHRRSEQTQISAYLDKSTAEVYGILDRWAPMSDGEDCISGWTDRLEGIAWIWLKEIGKFVKPDQLAWNPRSDLAPILNRVPPSLSSFRQLLSMPYFSIENDFETEAYNQCLQSIKEKKSIDAEDVKHSIHILRLMLDTEDDIKGGRFQKSKFSVPTHFKYGNKKAALVPASEVVFMNTVEEFNEVLESNEKAKDFSIVHGDVPNDLIQRLKISPVRDLFFQENDDEAEEPEEEEREYGVSITSYLRDTLRQYPPGAGIVKELLQNADDAGATVFKICLDKRSWPSGGDLFDPAMSSFLGPALLCFNDSVFNNDDVNAILRPGNSSKANDMSKTGKFGLGFNSVYHITDMPSFLTIDKIFYLDPHKRYLPKKLSTGIRRSNYEYKFTTAAKLEKSQGSWRPFDRGTSGVRWLPDIASQQEFQGSLFRLPFRQNDHESELFETGKGAWSDEKTMQSFAQFYKDIVVASLFLKSVKDIEILVWETDEPQPKLVYGAKTSVGAADLPASRSMPDLLRDKKKLLTALLQASKSPQKAFETNYACTVATKVADVSGFFEACATIKNPIAGLQTGESSFDYVVTRRLGIDSSEVMREAYRKAQVYAASRSAAANAQGVKIEKFTHLPLVSVAGLVRKNGMMPSQDDAAGRLCCVLPLPKVVGLPFHVDGTWELDSNRNNLWTSETSIGEGIERQKWNELLRDNILVPCFCSHILALRDRFRQSLSDQETTNHFYTYFMAFPQRDHKSLLAFFRQGNLVKSMYQQLAVMPVVPRLDWDNREETGWLKPQEGCWASGIMEKLSMRVKPVWVQALGRAVKWPNSWMERKQDKCLICLKENDATSIAVNGCSHNCHRFHKACLNVRKDKYTKASKERNKKADGQPVTEFQRQMLLDLADNCMSCHALSTWNRLRHGFHYLTREAQEACSVRKILVKDDMPLVDAPEFILEELKKAVGDQVKPIEPSFAREHYKSAWLQKYAPEQAVKSNDPKQLYALSDPSRATVMSQYLLDNVTNLRLDDLTGLPMLRIATGHFTTFSASKRRFLLAPQERMLFPANLENCVFDCDVPQFIKNQLDWQEKLNIRRIKTIQEVVFLLDSGAALPLKWKAKTSMPWDPNEIISGDLTYGKWLHKFWQLMAGLKPRPSKEDLTKVEWPLVPGSDGRLYSPMVLQEALLDRRLAEDEDPLSVILTKKIQCPVCVAPKEAMFVLSSDMLVPYDASGITSCLTFSSTVRYAKAGHKANHVGKLVEDAKLSDEERSRFCEELMRRVSYLLSNETKAKAVKKVLATCIGALKIHQKISGEFTTLTGKEKYKCLGFAREVIASLGVDAGPIIVASDETTKVYNWLFDIPTLRRGAYIREAVLPILGRTTEEKVTKIIQYIHMECDKLVEQDEPGKFMAALKAAPLVQKYNRLWRFEEFLIPRSASDRRFVENFFEHKLLPENPINYQSKSWTAFALKLGAKEEIRDEHIEDAVLAITKGRKNKTVTSPKDSASVGNKFFSPTRAITVNILEYLLCCDLWGKVPFLVHYRQVIEDSTWEKIRKLAFLPCMQHGSKEVELAAPQELVSFEASLVCFTQRKWLVGCSDNPHFCNLLEEKAGFQTVAPLGDALKHAKTIVQKWPVEKFYNQRTNEDLTRFQNSPALDQLMRVLVYLSKQCQDEEKANTIRTFFTRKKGSKAQQSDWRNSAFERFLPFPVSRYNRTLSLHKLLFHFAVPERFFQDKPAPNQLEAWRFGTEPYLYPLEYDFGTANFSPYKNRDLKALFNVFGIPQKPPETVMFQILADLSSPQSFVYAQKIVVPGSAHELKDVSRFYNRILYEMAHLGYVSQEETLAKKDRGAVLPAITGSQLVSMNPKNYNSADDSDDSQNDEVRFLKPSEEIAIRDDAPWFLEEKLLDPSKIYFLAPEIADTRGSKATVLPVLGMQKLSSLVQQIIDKKTSDLTEVNPPPGYLKGLEELVKDPRFLNGLLRLILKQRMSQDQDYEAPDDLEEDQEYEKISRAFPERFLVVKEIGARYIHSVSQVDITNPENHGGISSIVRGNEILLNSTKLFEKDKRGEKHVIIEIVERICEALQRSEEIDVEFEHGGFSAKVKQYLFDNDLKDIEKELDRKRIPRVIFLGSVVPGAFVKDEDLEGIGPPGGEIPDSTEIPSFTRKYLKDDFVAYRDHGDKGKRLRYARIEKCTDECFNEHEVEIKSGKPVVTMKKKDFHPLRDVRQRWIQHESFLEEIEVIVNRTTAENIMELDGVDLKQRIEDAISEFETHPKHPILKMARNLLKKIDQAKCDGLRKEIRDLMSAPLKMKKEKIEDLLRRAKQVGLVDDSEEVEWLKSKLRELGMDAQHEQEMAEEEERAQREQKREQLRKEIRDLKLSENTAENRVNKGTVENLLRQADEVGLDETEEEVVWLRSKLDEINESMQRPDPVKNNDDDKNNNNNNPNVPAPPPPPPNVPPPLPPPPGEDDDAPGDGGGTSDGKSGRGNKEQKNDTLRGGEKAAADDDDDKDISGRSGGNGISGDKLPRGEATSTTYGMDLRTGDRPGGADGSPLKVHFSFEPSLSNHTRTSSLDLVHLDGREAAFRIYSGPQRLDSPSEAVKRDNQHYDHFHAELKIDELGDDWVQIPSASCTDEVIAFEITNSAGKAVNAKIEFGKNSAYSLFVRSSNKFTERNVQLRYTLAAKKKYFVLPKLQAQPTPPRDWRKNIPKSFRKRGTTPWIPAALKEQADEIIEMLNITNEDRQAFFPAMLSIINFFKDFYPGEMPSGIKQDQALSMFQKLCRSQCGSCRHRATAFCVVAHAMGFPARLLLSEIHAWCEVWLPDGTWRQVDLGGAPGRWDESEDARHETYRPQGQDENSQEGEDEKQRLRRELALARQQLHDLREWVKSQGLVPPDPTR